MWRKQDSISKTECELNHNATDNILNRGIIIARALVQDIIMFAILVAKPIKNSIK